LLPHEIVWRKDKIGYEPPQTNWLENKQVQEKIYQSKKTLYQKNIISKKESERKIVFSDSGESSQKTWAIWMAGEMF
jgi:asparagine synthase (glutamine-hydrolysing)